MGMSEGDMETMAAREAGEEFRSVVALQMAWPELCRAYSIY